VIIAHPDDEIIWMGGCLARYANSNWTILSLCRASDNDRSPKFKRVCKILGVKGIICDLDDKNILEFEQATQEAEKIIFNKIKDQKFDFVFSHGENGEYGHPRHKNIYLAVLKLLKEKKFATSNFFCFNYRKDGKHKVRIKKDSDFVIKLDKDEFKNKKEIVAYEYGYDIKGIDVGYCKKQEAFLKVNIF